jgi:hypothetical protein
MVTVRGLTFFSSYDWPRGIIKLSIRNDTTLPQRVGLGGCAVRLVVRQGGAPERWLWPDSAAVCLDYLAIHEVLPGEVRSVEWPTGSLPPLLIDQELLVQLAFQVGGANSDTLRLRPAQSR